MEYSGSFKVMVRQSLESFLTVEIPCAHRIIFIPLHVLFFPNLDEMVLSTEIGLV